MSDTRGSVSGVSASGVANEAALIVTFYGSYTRIPQVHEKLYLALSGAPEDGNPVPSDWQDPSGEAFLRRFNAPAAHDTMVVQLALNAPGDATEAWRVARRHLEDLLDTGAPPAGWWGYTLTYQAVLPPGVTADEALSELLPEVRLPCSSEGLHELARSKVSSGNLWLMGIPDGGDGLAAAMVYVALCSKDQEPELLRTIYGPGATLLMPDLIAHKGYHQMRQHRGKEIEDALRKNLDNLQRLTSELLGSLGEGDVDPVTFDRLARQYPPLVPVRPMLEELHTSMIRQLHNYDRWLTRIGDFSILEFHREWLETGAKELELLIRELNNALETADRAVSLAQVRVDKQAEDRQRAAEDDREHRRRRIEAWVAAVALALALPELLNQEATRALLDPLGLGPGPLNPNKTVPTGDVLLLLGTQIAIIIAAALLTGLAVNFLLRKLRGQ